LCALQKRSALTQGVDEDADVETVLLAQSSAVEAAPAPHEGGAAQQPHAPQAPAGVGGTAEDVGAQQQARGSGGHALRPLSAAATTGGRGRWGGRPRLSLAQQRGGHAPAPPPPLQQQPWRPQQQQGPDAPRGGSAEDAAAGDFRGESMLLSPPAMLHC
jgi:hypothetical protein